jgi:hypothetical protein
MKNGPGVVVTVRKCEMKGRPAPGSSVVLCTLGCKQAVVLSPAGKRRADQGWDVGCRQCVDALGATGKVVDFEIELPSREDLLEAFGFMGRN